MARLVSDAAPIEVNGQREKFLFYRGLAGFPVGDYNVEVFFNGQSVASRPFHVHK